MLDRNATPILLDARCGSIVIALAAVLGLPGCGAGSASGTRGPEAVPVVVGKAERKTVPVVVRSIGNVEAASSVSIRPQVGGEIVRVGFAEGTEVRRGAVLFEIDDRTYRAAVAQSEAVLSRDRALLKKAEEDVKRYQGLVAKDYVTKEQFDQVQANVEALRATIRADEAAVDTAKLQLDYCTIRAPIDGRTGKLLVHPGNVVKANDDNPLVVLLQTRPIFVTFSAPEPYLDEIRRRVAAGTLPVSVTSTGDGGEVRSGKLEFVDNTVDTTTGTIRLKATFPNQDGGLWPGQFVEVRLTLSEQRDAVVVPSQAVQNGQQGTFIYVVKGDSVESRPVTVDRSLGGETVIAKGLDGGETIVTDGQLRLYPGARVEIKPEVGS